MREREIFFFLGAISKTWKRLLKSSYCLPSSLCLILLLSFMQVSFSYTLMFSHHQQIYQKYPLLLTVHYVLNGNCSALLSTKRNNQPLNLATSSPFLFLAFSSFFKKNHSVVLFSSLTQVPIIELSLHLRYQEYSIFLKYEYWPLLSNNLWQI